MSRIDVAYGAEHRIKQACQTVYKRFLAGGTVWVYCTDDKRLDTFSKMLWSVEATAFVPHPALEDKDVLSSQVRICRDLSEQSFTHWVEGQAKPWLLNLDVLCPPFVMYFDRVLEIISTHPEDRRLARERMAIYKQEGHQIVYHDLSSQGAH